MFWLLKLATAQRAAGGPVCQPAGEYSTVHPTRMLNVGSRNAPSRTVGVPVSANDMSTVRLTSYTCIGYSTCACVRRVLSSSSGCAWCLHHLSTRRRGPPWGSVPQVNR